MGIIQRQSIKSSIATYIGVAIGAFNIGYLFPNYLLPEQFGLTRVLVAVAILFSQAALLGAPFALMRFHPFFKSQQEKDHGFPSLMLLITLAGFLVISVIVFAFRFEIERIYSENSPLFSAYFMWIFPLAFLMALGELIFSYCRALIKLPIPIFFREVMLRGAQSVALLLFILHWISFEVFLALFAGSYLLQLLLLIGYVIYLRQFFFFSRIHLEGKIALRQILRFSFLMFAAVSAAIYTQNIDVILLSYLLNLTNTGVYSFAFFVGTIVQVPARSMNMIATSIVAQAWKENDHQKIQRLYSQTSLNQLIIGGFVFLMIWVNIDLLLSFLPSIYHNGKWVIFVIAIGKLFDMASGINGEIINVSKHVKVNLITNISLIIIATVSNYFFIQWYGIIGAAIATALSLVMYNVIRMIFLYYKYKLQPFDINTLKAVALFLIALAVVMLLPQLKNLWISGIYQSIIVSIIFLIPLLYFRISSEINNSFEALISNVRK